MARPKIRAGRMADRRTHLNEAIDKMVMKNSATKRNGQKFVSKLRRWQTRHLGSRALRVKLLEAYPCITIGNVVVK
jgi:hypothetical protein